MHFLKRETEKVFDGAVAWAVHCVYVCVAIWTRFSRNIEMKWISRIWWMEERSTPHMNEAHEHVVVDTPTISPLQHTSPTGLIDFAGVYKLVASTDDWISITYRNVYYIVEFDGELKRLKRIFQHISPLASTWSVFSGSKRFHRSNSRANCFLFPFFYSSFLVFNLDVFRQNGRI